MREAYKKELTTINQSVADMAALARGMLTDGVQSFTDLDKELAEQVVGRKDELAQMDDDIEAQALNIAARQQPMAGDLRALAAALKLITYINRLGRYGKDIAQITLQWPLDKHLARPVQIPMMAKTVNDMLDAVMKSYVTRKDFSHEQIMEWEETLDATRWTVFRESLTYMAQQPQNIEPGAHYMMIARYLERCGDNVCKMAEKVQYMLTGKRIVLR